MESKLKVVGEEKIGNIKFTGIEGGFGENKKAMLVKDIAKIHGTTIKRVNELINRNSNRFRLSIDLLDLKQVVPNDLFSDYGFTKAQWGNSSHIYLLSERGYAKLLKILNDDKAWDIYDELVDNYFNMRTAINQDEPTIVQKERLKIMKDNASTRRATLLYKLAMETGSSKAKEHLLAKATKELVKDVNVPVTTERFYNSRQVAREIGLNSPLLVDRIASQIGLNENTAFENEYGHWENDEWLYNEKGLREIAKNNYIYSNL